jgi:hypothetical protein
MKAAKQGKGVGLGAKIRICLYMCIGLVALVAVPSPLFADSHCFDPPPFQYQSCGSVAPVETFTVNSTGLLNGVYGVFEGFSANFADGVYALQFRNGSQINQSAETATNQVLGIDTVLSFFTAAQLQSGDQIEFVLDVQNDPNGRDLLYSNELTKNKDGLNHMWGLSLTGAANCAPGQPTTCAYVGFEDLPSAEHTDWDYNDFEMWVYGADISPGANSGVPEPSSLLLLTGAPLAFAFRILRNKRR